MRKVVLSENPETIADWDGYFSTTYPFYQYIYYLPLCYQLFTDTENSKNWGAEYGTLAVMCAKTVMRLNKLLKLDKQPEPGFTIIYILAKMLSLLLLLVIILFIYKIGKFTIKTFPKISKHNLK
jgi:hypothetical protein